MQFQKVMVLADGETYTSLQGCMIVAVPADYDGEQIEEALDALKMFTSTNADDDSEGFIVATFGDGE